MATINKMLFSSAANCWSSDHNACHFGVSSHRRPSATTKLVSLAWSWLSGCLTSKPCQRRRTKKSQKITPRKLDHKDNVLDIALVGIVGFHDFASQPNTPNFHVGATIRRTSPAVSRTMSALRPLPPPPEILGVDLKKKRFRLVNS